MVKKPEVRYETRLNGEEGCVDIYSIEGDERISGMGKIGRIFNTDNPIMGGFQTDNQYVLIVPAHERFRPDIPVKVFQNNDLVEVIRLSCNYLRDRNIK